MHVRRPNLHERVIKAASAPVAASAPKVPEVRTALDRLGQAKPRNAGPAPARGPSGTAR